MHGRESAFKAGLVQGAYSFLLTFVMTLLIETIFKALMKILHHKPVVAGLTIMLTCAMVFSGSWYVNYLAGTPEIFNTVILGYVLGGVYTLVYTVVMAEQKH